MVKLSKKMKPCIICYRLCTTTTTRRGPGGLSTSKEQQQALKRFFQLLGRHLGFGDGDNNNDKPVDGDLHEEEQGASFTGEFENLIQAGMLSCEECSKTMGLFSELFHQMKVIQLHLNWQLKTLEKMMGGGKGVSQQVLQNCAKHLQFGGGGAVGGSSESGKVELLLKFRRDLIKKCRRKLRASSPRLTLDRCLPQAEVSASGVPMIITMEGQSEAGLGVITDLIKTEPEGLPPPPVEVIAPVSSMRALFRCPTCSKTFSSQSSLKEHQESHEQEGLTEAVEETWSENDNDHRDGNDNDWTGDPDDGVSDDNMETQTEEMKGVQDGTTEKGLTTRKSVDNGQLSDPEIEAELEAQVAVNPESGRFRCGRCSREYHRRKACRRHYQQVHLRLRLFPCPTCSRSFFRSDNLSKHRQTVHGGGAKKAVIGPHKCSHCGNGFSSRGQLRRHLRIVHSIKMERIRPGRPPKPISSLELQQAMERDPSPSEMAAGPPGSSGVTGSSTTTPFKCPICSKVFSRRDQLYQHRYRVKCQPGPVFRKSRTPKTSLLEPSIPKPSPAPPKKKTPKKKTLSVPTDYSKGVWIAPSTRNAETGKYKCDLCQKEFRSTSYLKDHRNSIHFNQASYPCPLCSKVYRHRNDYWKHKRVHQGLTYPCPQCGKNFNQWRCLARHQRLKLCSININGGSSRRPRGSREPNLKPPVSPLHEELLFIFGGQHPYQMCS